MFIVEKNFCISITNSFVQSLDNEGNTVLLIRNGESELVKNDTIKKIKLLMDYLPEILDTKNRKIFLDVLMQELHNSTNR